MLKSRLTKTSESQKSYSKMLNAKGRYYAQDHNARFYLGRHENQTLELAKAEEELGWIVAEQKRKLLNPENVSHEQLENFLIHGLYESDFPLTGMDEILGVDEAVAMLVSITNDEYHLAEFRKDVLNHKIV